MFLADAFKYRITVPWNEVHIFTGKLDYPRSDAPNGSSYAVTSDAPQGKRYIHLTRASFLTLYNAKLIPADYEEVTS
jgi:hypothetical protein